VDISEEFLERIFKQKLYALYFSGDILIDFQKDESYCHQRKSNHHYSFVLEPVHYYLLSRVGWYE
jgi:hypothetical protein